MNTEEARAYEYDLNKDFYVLLDIVKTLHVSHELEIDYDKVLKSVARLQNVELVLIYLVNEDISEARLKSHINASKPYLDKAATLNTSHGILWQVIERGEQVVVSDSSELGDLGSHIASKSLIGVPVLSGESVRGAVWFGSSPGREFNEIEADLITSIGSEIASAILREERTNELEERYRNLSLISSVSQEIHKAIDLRLIYMAVLHITKDLKLFDRICIYILDTELDSHDAVLQIQSGYSKEHAKKMDRIPSPRGLTWQVIESGQPIEHNSQTILTLPGDTIELEKDEKCSLSIPIITGDKVIGAFHFLSSTKSKFSKQDIDFLTSFSSQVGAAIVKANMFNEIQERASELGELYENLRNTQNQLVQTEKLASLGQLVASIAHEINNPLTPILGYSQMLLTSLEDEPEKVSKYLQIIHNSADKVKRIVDNLLSFSRKDKPKREYADVNELIEKSIEFREYQLGLSNISVKRELDPNLPKTMIDSTQIQQVLTNIILNADQAIREARNNGELLVKSCVGDSDMIEITISDNGPGIPREVLQRIFDPFFTTKPVGVGTGLGLSVSYGIVKEHGGEIYAKSESDQGSVFVVQLPIINYRQFIQMQEAEEELETQRELNKQRVLVIEDEELIIALMEGILEDEGYNTDLAYNGEDALLKLRENRYDLVVCDIKMPLMDGRSFYNEVKEKNPELANRIIFITGDPSEDTMRFINDTGNVFLTKPFKIEEFRRLVYELDNSE